MTTETVIVGPPSVRPVLAALLDLSAAGVLDPFTWIEAPADPARAADAGDPQALHISSGRVEPTTFSRVTNRHDLELVRLAVAVPLGIGATDVLSGSAEQFYQLLPTAGRSRTDTVRVLIPLGAEADAVQLGRHGWRDVMLSPESTADPSFVAVGWWGRPEQIPGAAAVGLAVQTGLVASVDDAPGDAQFQDVSEDVEVVRTFVRIADARAVESELRGEVTGLERRFPAPTRPDVHQQVRPFASESARVREATESWAQLHEEDVRRRPVDVPVSTAATVGFWQAWGMFFGFLAKALTGAPVEWVRQQLHAARSTVAAGVTEIVFGDDAGVSVVVGGVDSRGRTAGWREVTAAARTLGASLPGSFARSEQPPRRDFASLWTNLTGGARSLLDASEYAPLAIRPYEGCVTDRDLIAPPLDQGGSYTFTEGVGAIPAGTVLHSWDALAIERALNELESLSGGGDPRAHAAAGHRAALQQWRESGSDRYLPQIGRTLAAWFMRTRHDAAQLHDRLRSLLAEDVGESIAQGQKRLAWTLRFMLAAMLAVLVLDWFVWHQAWISTTAFWTTAIIAVVVWLLVSLWVFVVRQREVFQLLHRRREQERAVPALAANLRMAIEDLEGLGEAYAQFDRWAMVLTCFLADPLGAADAPAPPEAQAVDLPTGLQRTTVRAQPEHVSDVAARLRSATFDVGWLSLAWEAMLARAGDDLSPEQRWALTTGQSSLYSESGLEGSALSRWADGLRQHGVRSEAAQNQWDRCVRLLDSPDGPRIRLLPAGSGAEARDLERSREDLTHPSGKPVVQHVLGDRARVQQRQVTDPKLAWFRESAHGLSRTMVLVETTHPIPASDFIYPAPRTVHAWGDDPAARGADADADGAPPQLGDGLIY